MKGFPSGNDNWHDTKFSLPHTTQILYSFTTQRHLSLIRATRTYSAACIDAEHHGFQNAAYSTLYFLPKPRGSTVTGSQFKEPNTKERKSRLGASCNPYSMSCMRNMLVRWGDNRRWLLVSLTMSFTLSSLSSLLLFLSSDFLLLWLSLGLCHCYWHN